MYLRQVSDRSFELNRNKNYVSFLRVGTFTRQDDGTVTFFPKGSGEGIDLEILNNIQVAMIFLMNRINFEGEHHF